MCGLGGKMILPRENKPGSLNCIMPRSSLGSGHAVTLWAASQLALSAAEAAGADEDRTAGAEGRAARAGTAEASGPRIRLRGLRPGAAARLDRVHHAFAAGRA